MHIQAEIHTDQQTCQPKDQTPMIPGSDKNTENTILVYKITERVYKYFECIVRQKLGVIETFADANSTR